MNKTCKQCEATFDVTLEDLKFYEEISPSYGGKKLNIPPPTLCGDCRMQRRLAHANESKLYHRKCDLTGRQIISVYSQDKPLIVYEQKEWWGDRWNGISYGRPFDFSRDFFTQFQELFREVPLMSLLVDGNENADYVNFSGWNKNCYLCFCVEYAEDAYYCHDTYHAKDVMDCTFGYQLERCYECVGCKDSHNLCFSQDCVNCSDSWYLYDCVGCRNCFACTGLKHKEFHFFNEQLSKEEYEKRLAEFHALGLSKRQLILQKIADTFRRYPRRAMAGLQNENCLGNYLFNSRNARNCYDSTDLQDCAWCTNVRGAKDCHDISRWGNPAELCYECAAIGVNTQRCAFCQFCWNGNSDLYYCMQCHNSEHCFGCIGLRRAKYCILNKQYTKEDYEATVPKIIAHMQQNKEWGEFFPAERSAHGYNETVAQEYFPMTKDDVIARGWHWYDDPNRSDQYLGPDYVIPDHIKDVSDEITGQILRCEATGKPYKIIPQELQYYREMNLPVPRLCPEERHRERLAKRNPRKLWKRQCAHCRKEIMTTYQPSRPEIVYCEQCYLKEVY